MKKNLSLFVLVVLFSFRAVIAQTITMTPFATGFGKISDIKSAGDSRMFIVEQTGKIKITDSVGTVNPTPFLTLTGLTSGNEQGLLGLAFHPNYATNGYFYVDYTDASGKTHISRFTVSANPNVANAASEVNLLTIYQPYTNHNGGNLQFGKDGYLYVNMGDGGSGGDPGNRAQNKDSLLGKILRLDVSNPVTPYYYAPTDNPFYGPIPGRDEIFTYGMRNPWRSSFDRITGDLWIADVGQGTWEEIDFRRYGDTGPRNYGWHCREGFVSYTGCSPAPSDTVSPIAVYDHAGTSSCSGFTACSVTGGYIYRGTKYSDLWGYYFYLDYCIGVMHSIKSNGTGGWILNNAVSSTPTCLASITTFGQDRYGELYMGNQGTGSNATVYRINGSTLCPNAFITLSDTLFGCDSVKLQALQGESMTYQWKLENVNIPGANSPVLYAHTNGNYSVAVTNTVPCTNISPSVYVVASTTSPMSITGFDTSYCHHHIPVSLTGAPSGGVFSGPGITGGSFYADSVPLGQCIITYTKTYNQGCIRTLTDTTNVQVPNVQITAIDTLIGICEPKIALAGSPAGGDFTGTGVSGGFFYPDSAGLGPHSIYYFYTDPSGCANTDTFNVNVDICEGIMQDFENSHFDLYPNPGKDHFTLMFETGIERNVNVTVVDVSGKEFFGQKYSCKKGRNIFTMNLKDAASGIYFVQVSDGDRKHTERLIIQK